MSTVIQFSRVESKDPSNVMIFQSSAVLLLEELKFIKTPDSILIDCMVPKLHTTIKVPVPPLAQRTPATFALENFASFTRLQMTTTRSNGGRVVTHAFAFRDTTGASQKTWTVTLDHASPAASPTIAVSQAVSATSSPPSQLDDVPSPYTAPPQLPRSDDYTSVSNISIPTSIIDGFIANDYADVPATDYESLSQAALDVTRATLGVVQNLKPFSYTDLCILHSALASAASTPPSTTVFTENMAAIQALKTQYQSGSDATLNTFPPLTTSTSSYNTAHASNPLPTVLTVPNRSLPASGSRTSSPWIFVPINPFNLNEAPIIDEESTTIEAYLHTHASASALAIQQQMKNRPIPWLVTYTIQHPDSTTTTLECNMLLEARRHEDGIKTVFTHSIPFSRPTLTAALTQYPPPPGTKMWIQIDDNVSERLQTVMEDQLSNTDPLSQDDTTIPGCMPL